MTLAPSGRVVRNRPRERPHRPDCSPFAHRVCLPIEPPITPTYSGFRPSRAACVLPSFRPSPPEHLSVPTLFAPRVPSVGSSRVSSLSFEYALVLWSVGDPITRSSFLPCLPCSLTVERTVIPTSVSGSFAALGTASSRLVPSWPAWPYMISEMPRFLFPVRSPLFSMHLLRFPPFIRIVFHSSRNTNRVVFRSGRIPIPWRVLPFV